MRYETGQDLENWLRCRYRVESHREAKRGNAVGGDYSRPQSLRRCEAGTAVRTRGGGNGGIGERLGRSGRGRTRARQVDGADRERRGTGRWRFPAAARRDQASFGDLAERPPRGGSATSPYPSRPHNAIGNRGSNYRLSARDRA